MTNSIDKPSMVEILQEVMDLIDGLAEGERKQVMAMLAERYKLTIKDKPAATRGGYAPRPKRRSW